VKKEKRIVKESLYRIDFCKGDAIKELERGFM